MISPKEGPYWHIFKNTKSFRKTLNNKMVFNGTLDREFYFLHYLITHIDMSYVYLIIMKL